MDNMKSIYVFIFIKEFCYMTQRAVYVLYLSLHMCVYAYVRCAMHADMFVHVEETKRVITRTGIYFIRPIHVWRVFSFMPFPEACVIA